MFFRVIYNYAQPIRAPTGAIQIDLFTTFTQQTNRSTRPNFIDGGSYRITTDLRYLCFTGNSVMAKLTNHFT